MKVGSGGGIGRVRELYEGSGPAARRFRFGLVLFDLAVFAFIVVSAFLPRSLEITAVSVVIGLTILADVAARAMISRERWRGLRHISTWADLAAMVAFLGAVAGRGIGSLRIVRTLAFLRSEPMSVQLRRDVPLVRRHEAVVFAGLDLLAFVFVMTGVIYANQRFENPDIGTYLDALYFTIGSLTTTGFNDVNLTGVSGRLVSIVITIVGLALLLRLVRAYLRQDELPIVCPVCTLRGHGGDAVYCRECGSHLRAQRADD
ncbi:MAG: ion transporter [Enterovirga sp.]|nr:ion transporter [Enterovirga sp.]